MVVVVVVVGQKGSSNHTCRRPEMCASLSTAAMFAQVHRDKCEKCYLRLSPCSKISI